ncbi:hypothetical protein [Candidatus Bacteroides intestinigallinarum]|nr:hypothetical protein [Candidatus Bacteroides intestinigallinarum]MCS3201542.1 hypothetical protein [Candidatus Bacteroides intestinigallinarum]
MDETLFVTADDLCFAEHKLTDLAMDFYQHGGKKLLYWIWKFFSAYI